MQRTNKIKLHNIYWQTKSKTKKERRNKPHKTTGKSKKQNKNKNYIIKNGEHFKKHTLRKISRKIERLHEIYRQRYKTANMLGRWIHTKKNRINCKNKPQKNKKNANDKEHRQKIARKVDLSIDRFDLDRFESIIAMCERVCVWVWSAYYIFYLYSSILSWLRFDWTKP